METIEERAYNAYPTFTAENVDLVKTAIGGYIKGATEQHKIDIDKALNFWHKILDSQGINQIVFQDFKKAMEE